MALAYSKQIVVLREIVLRDKPASMLQHSPKGTVPILVLNDGTVLEESLDIMLWALSQNDPDNWLPTTEAEQDKVKHYINYCDNEFKTHLDHYKYADRYPEHSAEYYRQQGESFLKELDHQLTTKPYLCGQQVSLADIAIFPFIRQFAYVDKTWFEQSNYHQLKTWLERQLTSKLFLMIMKKYTAWKTEDQATLFPGHVY